MPYMQGMAEKANVQFARAEGIDQMDEQRLAPGTTLAEAAEALGIAETDEEIAFLRSWPEGQQEAVRAALYSALTREPRLPVTFAWAPGYDYEVSIWEAPGTEKSVGGMTILMRSRYPDDPVPTAPTASTAD